MSTLPPLTARGLPIRFYRNPEYTGIRLQMLKYLLDELMTFRGFVEQPRLTQDHIIEQLEAACFNAACDRVLDMNLLLLSREYTMIYNNMVYNTISLLNPSSVVGDDRYVQLILQAPLTFDYMWFVMARPDELNPDLYADIKERCARIESVKPTEKSSAEQTCAKCKRNSVRTRFIINRSADEGRNRRATCTYCNHSWNC